MGVSISRSSQNNPRFPIFSFECHQRNEKMGVMRGGEGGGEREGNRIS